MRKSFLIRISPELWEEINRWAKDELRSVNGQIEYILRKAVRNHKSDSHSRKGRKAKNPVVEDSFSLLAGHSGSFKSSNKKF